MAVHGNNGRLAANSSLHTKNNTPTPMYMRSAMPQLPLPQHPNSQPQQQQQPQHHYSYGNPTYGHLGYATGSQSAGGMGGGGGQHNVYATSQYSATQTTSYWCSSSGGRSEAALMYRHCRPHAADKRKSAVELLAETKPFYVKTDSVMEHLAMGGVGGGGYMGGGGGCGAEQTAARKYVSPAKLHQGGGPPKVGGPQHMHHHHHHHQGHRGHGGGGSGGRHANGGPAGSLKLGRSGQMACNKLPPKRGMEAERYCRGDLNHMTAYEAGGRGQNQLPTTAIAYRNEPEEPSPLLNVQLPPTLSSLEDIYKLSDENSGGEEPLVLTENYRPISPPAEYAAETISIGQDMQHRGSGRYQRSYSHSQEADIVAYNINSHKSLPDLHTHINRQSPHSEILSCCSRGTSINRDSGGSSGHYTHRSEPCYQRQQRGDSSGTVSVGGGGGGGGGMGVSDHYVSVGGSGGGGQGASVPYLRDMRRDSGSSTQHSEYISPPSYAMQQHGGSGGHAGSGDGGLECHCKTPVQVDCAAGLPYDQYFGNFPTPEVPKAFQDDYSSGSKYSTGYGQPQPQPQPPPHHHHSHTHSHGGGGSYYCYPNDGGSYGNAGASAPPTHPPSPQQQQQHQQQSQMHGQMQQIAPMAQQQAIDDISPPPIQFKRQRCIRFKNHQRIPLPGSYPPHPSDSGEYYHGGNEASLPLPPPPMTQPPQPQVFIFPKYLPSDNSGGHQVTRGSLDDHQQQYPVTSPASKEYGGDHEGGGGGEQIGQLERFFDRLGLNEAKFHEIYSVPKHRKSTTSSGTGTTGGTNSDSDDSTVFFSDVSTVDSMRLPDSTETQPQATQSYRLSEPPSIVERNARIIKWLCNCKKMQQYA